jgi:hypothetical protein
MKDHYIRPKGNVAEPGLHQAHKRAFTAKGYAVKQLPSSASRIE